MESDGSIKTIKPIRIVMTVTPRVTTTIVFLGPTSSENKPPGNWKIVYPHMNAESNHPNSVWEMPKSSIINLPTTERLVL